MKNEGLKEEICKYLTDKGLELVSQPGYRIQIFIGKGIAVSVEGKESDVY